MILSAGLVAAGWLVGITASHQIAAGLSRIILLFFGVAFLAVQIGEVETFHEGVEVLTSRFETGAGTESLAAGLIGRFLDSFLTPLYSLEHAPLLGYGLGLGTNVGAALIQGEAGFLLSEGEWGRIILEMGPIIGMAFILYRVCLMFSLGKNALKCTQSGYVLPVLLWSSCATTIFNGQIGQPTNLGFMVLIAGLTLCAIGIARSESPAPDAKELRKPRRLGFR
jgi:hypothetical protein